MGTIRTILALAVVFGHAGAYFFTGGMLAVQLFYIIPGYLMSLILLSNSYKSVSSFYLNRFLRLFPIYWVVALTTLLIYFLFASKDYSFFSTYTELGVNSIWLVLSNVFLIGQDWIMFTGVSDGVFGFTTNYRESEVLVHQGLLVPQAWTLGVEISFYAIAPFILKNWKYWVSLLIISLALRVYFVLIGLGTEDPFSYRFFPLELALFLFGVFSHQILKPLYLKYRLLDHQKIVKGSTFFVMIVILMFHLIPVHTLFKDFIFKGIFVLALPLLAKFQVENRVDNWIGNLSYPIYICHVIVIQIMNTFFGQFNFSKSTLYYFSVIFASVFFAYVLEVFINRRVDIVRLRIREGRKS